MSDLKMSVSGVDLTIHNVSGQKLSDLFGVDAVESKYRHTGDWYHYIREYPVVLWDKYGYIRYETEEHFNRSNFFINKEDPDSLHLKDVKSISEIPGYVKVTD